MLTGSENVI